MKITRTIIKEFESQQKQYGTKIALSNIVFVLATDLLRNIGISRVSVVYDKRRK